MKLKYNKDLPKQKQNKKESKEIFTLRVFLTEIPFSFIRTFEFMSKVILTTKRSQWLFICSSCCFCALIVLPSIFMKSIFCMKLTGFASLMSLMILTCLSEYLRLQRDKGGSEESTPKEEENKEQGESPSQEESEPPVEDIKEEVIEEDIEEDKEVEMEPEEEMQELVEKVQKSDRQKMSMDEKIETDMQSLSLDEILDTDWMTNFMDVQNKLNGED